MKLEFQLGLDDQGSATCVSHFEIESAVEGAGTMLLNRGTHAGGLVSSVLLDGVAVDDFTLTEDHLTIPCSDGKHTVSITTDLTPQSNTALDGLYMSSGNYCTQCESEGFRHITPYPDRPDVMSVFSTRIEAPLATCPVLLSNGNLVAAGPLPNGRHYVEWQDPFPKPCYLFALVAGDLAVVSDKFVTMSGRDIELNVYVQENNKDKCQHALDSLKRAMKWDEDRFGLEYDLRLYNIVAVDDFNMGAMENKGLNIFNSRLVCATPETATDAEYHRIEGVVAHEYFHNWTGNRVTCRDWFQLTLKEGLTVFRDQEFSGDVHSRAVQRIEDVMALRNRQLVQDKGEMRHPIRPEKYIKVDNFYTTTIYEKGAEVVRMYQTLLGRKGFRIGMERYFARHDAQAVTCDDFLSAMNIPGANLEGLSSWYSQVGTPCLRVVQEYNEEEGVLHLHCSQSLPPLRTDEGLVEQPALLIPLSIGLIAKSDGRAIPAEPIGYGLVVLEEAQGTAVVRLQEREATFSFKVPEECIPSILRDFSAPVELITDHTEQDRFLLMKHDQDPFNQWAAKDALLQQCSEALWCDPDAVRPVPKLLVSLRDALVALLNRCLVGDLDKRFMAMLLDIPPCESQLVLRTAATPETPSAEVVFHARRRMTSYLGIELEPQLLQVLEQSLSETCSGDDAVAQRSLDSICLRLLAGTGKQPHRERILKHFHSARNMTQQMSALAALNFDESPERTEAFAAFEKQWQHDKLVMLKWLQLEGSSQLVNNTERVRALTKHPAFSWTNPNSVYSLIGSYTQDFLNFHKEDGSGYAFLGETILKLDAINGQVAARMAAPFLGWKNLDPKRQALMRAEIERLQTKPLTDNVSELLLNATEHTD